MSPPVHTHPWILVALLAFGAATGCHREQRTVTVSAAISLKEPLEEVAAAFRAAHPGVAVNLNLASSGSLRQQIEAGAPVDVYLSASVDHLEALARRGLLDPATRRTLCHNVLVVVVPRGAAVTPRGPADLAGPAVHRLALGNPRTVPAGAYAERSLRSLGLWDRVAGRIVPAENVRQALDYVARGEVDAGFVYVTDVARARGAVREAFRPPAASYPTIEYPGAVLRAARAPALARAFLDSFTGPAGRAALRRHGFVVADAAGASQPAERAR